MVNADSFAGEGSHDSQSKSNNRTIDNYELKIERLYVKEMNCKIPHAPGLFESMDFKETTGQMIPSIEVSTKVQPISANKYEVTLHAIVHGKIKQISLFTLEVQQAGIFVVNVPQPQLKYAIEINCASYLHVYLSQAITNAILQTSFPPIILQPLQPFINQNLMKEQNYSAQDILNQNIQHVNGVVLGEGDNKKT